VITVGDRVRFDGPPDIRKDLGLDGSGRNAVTTGIVKEVSTGDPRMCNVLFDMTACLAWVSIEHLKNQGANPEHRQGQGQGTADYSSEIYSQMFRDEVKFQPFANYFQQQTEINGGMRAILVDWLVQVHKKHRLRPETLYLTVNLIDRYLSRISATRKKLQLVGVVAMLIASKFEEIKPPDVADLVYVTADAYTKEDIFEMECCMLTTLDFQLVVPTAAHFLERLRLANNSTATHDQLCRYLVELSLPDVRTIRHAPSHLVAAATLVSNELMERQPAWPAHMVQATCYSEAQLRPCADELRTIFEGAATNSLQAVRQRYMLQTHHCVAGMTFHQILRPN